MRRRLRRRYGHTRRYGHSHPLFPRLVMYFKRLGPREYVIEGKLQRDYGGAWHTVCHERLPNTEPAHARQEFRRLIPVVASKHNVPDSHVETA